MYTIAYRPDGALIAMAGEDGVIRFWDPASGADHPLPTAAT